MKSPPDMLADVGRALYGQEHWRRPLARALGIDQDTLRRWLTGRSSLQADHPVFTVALIAVGEHRARVDDIRNELRSWLTHETG